MVRNITGAPTEGDDFFERPNELARLLRELEQGANLRINAPRRVGKTSLVLRLNREWQKQGHDAIFLNVEDTTDELSFAEKLVNELIASSLQPDVATRCKLWLGKARKSLGISKISAGLDIELGDVDPNEPSTLSKAVESVFEKIEAEGKSLLIAIDEMPEVLVALSKANDGPLRVARLLHWLRALRQTYRQHIRWIFLGSIGLEGFVEERLLGKTINDLTPFELSALSQTEADAFLVRLGQDNGLPLPPNLRTEIITRVGWPLPHHLQIVFHALRELNAITLDNVALEQAFNHLLGPSYLSQFDTWRQRLDEQFASAEASTAKTILNHLCQFTGGRSRQQIFDALMLRKPMADTNQVEEQLARLLQLLQRDGYFLACDGSYVFRSFLLRDYWYRRYIL